MGWKAHKRPVRQTSKIRQLQFVFVSTWKRKWFVVYLTHVSHSKCFYSVNIFWKKIVKPFVSLKTVFYLEGNINALSFYRSQNVLALVQIFCARPKIYLHIVAVTNILCKTKIWFAFSKIGVCAGTKVFEDAINAIKLLGWLKLFEPAQSILEQDNSDVNKYVVNVSLVG